MPYTSRNRTRESLQGETSHSRLYPKKHLTNTAKLYPKGFVGNHNPLYPMNFDQKFPMGTRIPLWPVAKNPNCSTPDCPACTPHCTVDKCPTCTGN